MKQVALRLSRTVTRVVLFLATVITADADIVKLAESGDQEPNTTNQFFLFSGFPTLNSRGEVAFYTDLRYNGFLQGYGIYLADGDTIKVLAHAPQPAPDLNGNFSFFYDEVALSDSNQAFQVNLSGTLGGTSDDTAMYELNGSTLTLLAREGQAAPGFSGTFKNLEDVPIRINRVNQTAFTCITSSSLVVYRSTGSTLTPMAFSGEALPDASGIISGPSDPTLNNNGKVAFFATLSGGGPYGYLLADGSSLAILARANETSPDGNGYFLGFPSTEAAFNDNGQLAFVALLAGTTGGSADNQGLYRTDGSTTKQLARKGQIVPGGNGLFLDFGGQGHVAINNSSVVAFYADLTGTSGGSTDNAAIYLTDGNTITQIARKGQAARDGNGTYSGFGYPALNNKGEVAFTATLTGTAQGTTDNKAILLADASHNILQVARSGRVIDGETLYNPGFLDGPDTGGSSGLNDSGQLAFFANLNGNDAVFLWSRPEITAVTPVGNDVQIDLKSFGAKTNVLQAASNLGGNFVDVSSIILPGNGLVRTNFTETGTATHTARFYRLYEK